MKAASALRHDQYETALRRASYSDRLVFILVGFVLSPVAAFAAGLAWRAFRVGAGL